jgi:serine/threonine protein kinase
MIPKVYGFYTDGLKASDQSGINSEKPGVHYFVQDYLGENNLWELLDFQAFNETQAKFILRQLISGVEYLHCNNVAHGDIKPENLFLDKDGNLKLNNFDVCSNISAGNSAANKKISTKNYCAPEILQEDYSE